VYTVFENLMKVGITDAEKGRCLSKMVEGIEDWNTLYRNPYKIVNHNRDGFVGRDIMLKLLARITLDPEAKESMWELL